MLPFPFRRRRRRVAPGSFTSGYALPKARGIILLVFLPPPDSGLDGRDVSTASPAVASTAIQRPNGAVRWRRPALYCRVFFVPAGQSILLLMQRKLRAMKRSLAISSSVLKLFRNDSRVIAAARASVALQLMVIAT